jgi:hypothetical protein
VSSSSSPRIGQKVVSDVDIITSLLFVSKSPGLSVSIKFKALKSHKSLLCVGHELRSVIINACIAVSDAIKSNSHRKETLGNGGCCHQIALIIGQHYSQKDIFLAAMNASIDLLQCCIENKNRFLASGLLAAIASGLCVNINDPFVIERTCIVVRFMFIC